MAGADGVQRLPLLERSERSRGNTESFNHQPTDSAEEPSLVSLTDDFADVDQMHLASRSGVRRIDGDGLAVIAASGDACRNATRRCTPVVNEIGQVRLCDPEGT